MTSLIDTYPRPKVGQYVRLHNGATAVVVTVYKANSVLKMMSEVEAIALASRAQSRFGHKWRDVYYHADILYSGGTMDVIDTSRVKDVLDLP